MYIEVSQVFLGLGCSFLVVVIGVVHVDAPERCLIREEQAVVEGITGVDVVAQRDVRQFQRDH